jgi:hypothetical protein
MTSSTWAKPPDRAGGHRAAASPNDDHRLRMADRRRAGARRTATARAERRRHVSASRAASRAQASRLRLSRTPGRVGAAEGGSGGSRSRRRDTRGRVTGGENGVLWRLAKPSSRRSEWVVAARRESVVEAHGAIIGTFAEGSSRGREGGLWRSRSHHLQARGGGRRRRAEGALCSSRTRHLDASQGGSGPHGEGRYGVRAGVTAEPIEGLVWGSWRGHR